MSSKLSPLKSPVSTICQAPPALPINRAWHTGQRQRFPGFYGHSVAGSQFVVGPPRSRAGGPAGDVVNHRGRGRRGSGVAARGARAQDARTDAKKSRMPIRSALLTPRNVNETSVADALIRGDERAVYGDKAYASRARRQRLRAAGIEDRIMHKSWGGGPPLTAWQRRRNALIAPRRASVETVFAVLKRRMAYMRARYIGLIKNSAHLLLLALAYNMRRASALAA
jgi:IS5 family transposase